MMTGTRVHLAVTFFVVLSGFVMQLAHGARPMARGRALAGFYLRRLDRVLLTTWLSMLADLLLNLDYATGTYGSRQWDVDGAQLTRCFLLVAPWWHPQWLELDDRGFQIGAPDA
eukprot:2613161-Prymnesium_polylepis.1